MKNILTLLALIFFALSSCQKSNETKHNSDNLNSILLSEFLIGQWNGTFQVTDIHGSYTKKYHIEFVNTNKLLLQMSSPYNGINDKFDYEFINASTVLVENKRAKGGKWSISRDDENLLICIWSDTDNCVVFTREN